VKFIPAHVSFIAKFNSENNIKIRWFVDEVAEKNKLAAFGPRCRWTRLGRKMNFAPGKIPLGGKSFRKCICSVPAQETAKHRAKFGWPPLSDVGAVTKPRRETRWNLQNQVWGSYGSPFSHRTKLASRSQSLVGRSSPYYDEDVWRRYCCLANFPDCRSMP